MIARIKQFIEEKMFWTSGRVFSINDEIGEVIIKSDNDFQKIYYDPTEGQPGVYVGEPVKYKFISDPNNDKKKKIVVRSHELSR